MIRRKFLKNLSKMAKVNSVRIQSVVVNLPEPQIISMPSIFSLCPVFAYFSDEKTEGKVNSKSHAQGTRGSMWWAGLFIHVGFSSHHSVQ